MMKTWVRFWFVLEESTNRLLYFNARDDAKCVGSLDVSSAETVKASQIEELGIELTFIVEGKLETTSLLAESEDERGNWLKELTFRNAKSTHRLLFSEDFEMQMTSVHHLVECSLAAGGRGSLFSHDSEVKPSVLKELLEWGSTDALDLSLQKEFAGSLGRMSESPVSVSL